MYRSPKQLDTEQFEATRGIETTPAYQAYEGSSQLIVPTKYDESGNVVATRTVHAKWQSALSINRSVWKDSAGAYYHVIPKCKFYPEEVDCACS